MRIQADRDVCIGSGTCALTCSDVFDQEDNGTVIVLQEEPPAALEDTVRAAVSACPTLALRIEE